MAKKPKEPEELDFAELVERITKGLNEMTGKELAQLYNEHFGDRMVYKYNDVFEQTKPE